MVYLALFRRLAKLTSPISRLCVSTVAVNLTECSSNRVLIGRIPSILSSSGCSTKSRQYEPYYLKFKKKRTKKYIPGVDHVGRLDLRIGKVVDIARVPDTDLLYMTKVNIGEKVLSIVAALAKVIPSDELLHKHVVVLCNISATLRGQVTEGMIMCAKANGQTELLQPPLNAVPGDLVYCEGYERVPVETPRTKQRLYDALAPDLLTNDQLVACYKGASLFVMEKGNILAKSLKNAHIS